MDAKKVSGSRVTLQLMPSDSKIANSEWQYVPSDNKCQATVSTE